MPKDLQLSHSNPLYQIAGALQVLGRTRHQQELALARYGTAMGVYEFSLRCYYELDPTIKGQIKNILTLLRTGLSDDFPETCGALQAIDVNLPLLATHLDFSHPYVRENAEAFLQTVVLMLDSLYTFTDRLEIFRVHVEGLRDIQEIGVFQETYDVLEAIDNSRALSNRHWFYQQDMADYLRTALLSAGN